jgi:inhibitor of KinA
MPAETPKIFPLGDSALVVEFGREISAELNARAIGLANHLDAKPFAGYIESVPAYASTAVFYDAFQVRQLFPAADSAFHSVANILEPIFASLDLTVHAEARLIEIPMNFAGEGALDLAFVSGRTGLTPNDVIDIFTSVDYRVFMLGFLPGFTYMGDVDPRIATPRKETPRLKTPKGSIGIAGRQTGIYPFESPGGWQIIGRTNIQIFDSRADPPCLLLPGDTVRFVPT